MNIEQGEQENKEGAVNDQFRQRIRGNERLLSAHMAKPSPLRLPRTSALSDGEAQLAWVKSVFAGLGM